MENILEKKMFNYFAQLNEQEKKSVIQMLKAFLNGRSESIEYIRKDSDQKAEKVK